jgi:hypothetical protein
VNPDSDNEKVQSSKFKVQSSQSGAGLPTCATALLPLSASFMVGENTINGAGIIPESYEQINWFAF